MPSDIWITINTHNVEVWEGRGVIKDKQNHSFKRVVQKCVVLTLYVCMGLYTMFVIAESTDGQRRHKLYKTCFL